MNSGVFKLAPLSWRYLWSRPLAADEIFQPPRALPAGGLTHYLGGWDGRADVGGGDQPLRGDTGRGTQRGVAVLVVVLRRVALFVDLTLTLGRDTLRTCRNARRHYDPSKAMRASRSTNARIRRPASSPASLPE